MPARHRLGDPLKKRTIGAAWVSDRGWFSLSRRSAVFAIARFSRALGDAPFFELRMIGGPAACAPLNEPRRQLGEKGLGSRPGDDC
jgi:hypothetical protein